LAKAMGPVDGLGLTLIFFCYRRGLTRAKKMRVNPRVNPVCILVYEKGTEENTGWACAARGGGPGRWPAGEKERRLTYTKRKY